MEIVINQFIGFLIGVLASGVLWYLLTHVKPRIEICSVIVFNPRKGSLLVKVRNERRRQATDIYASLVLIERKPDGRLFTLHSAQLRKDFFPALAPIQDLTKSWKLPTTGVFATDEGEKLLEILASKTNGEKRLVFTLSATDGLSGTKVVQQIAYSQENIKYGKFGLGFRIEEVQTLTKEAISADDE